MTRVLLVPGRSPAGPAHWMSLWAAAHPEYTWVRRRTTPDADLDARVAALDAALAADPEPAVLVATSLGCLTVARWAATHTVGHLNTASGHGPWPAGERLLADLLAHA